MKLFLFIPFVFLISCMQNKQVFICGDRECINKKEAKRYFEENLIIEIKITKNKEIKTYDLVKMNTGESENSLIKNKKVISDTKKLTKSDKDDIKKKLKEEKRIAKLIEKQKKIKLKEKKKMEKLKEKKQAKLAKLNKKDKKLNKKVINKNKINTSSTKKSNKQIVQYEEICSTLNKCEIDEISDYLMRIGKLKDYPDLTSN